MRTHQVFFVTLTSSLTLTSCSSVTPTPPIELAAATCIQPALAITTNPPIDQGHIFCGEVKNKMAKGFHSVAAATSVKTIKANLKTAAAATPPQTPSPILPTPLIFNAYNTKKYTLSDFTIQSGQDFATKTMSTMFPNICTASQVLKSIEYAYNNTYLTMPAPYKCNTNPSNRCGPSSPNSINATFCQISGKPVPLQTFFSNGTITTAYPL